MSVAVRRCSLIFFFTALSGDQGGRGRPSLFIGSGFKAS